MGIFTKIKLVMTTLVQTRTFGPAAVDLYIRVDLYLMTNATNGTLHFATRLVGLFTKIKLAMKTPALLVVHVAPAELRVLAMVIVNKMEKYAGVEESLAPMVRL